MSRPDLRYNLQALSSAVRAKLAELAECPMRVRTSNRITHAACPEFRSRDGNDAFTLCGLHVHHCDLQRCRHPDRHKARLFSARLADDALVDCITCLTRQARQEST